MDYTRISPVRGSVLRCLAAAISGRSRNKNLGKGTDFNFQGGIYGKAYNGPAYLGLALSVANNWMKTSRTVAMTGEQLSASFNAQTFGARAEAGYDVLYQDLTFTPFAAGQILAFRLPSYSETDAAGGGFGLNYTGKTETDLSSQVGVRVSTVVPLSAICLSSGGFGLPLSTIG